MLSYFISNEYGTNDSITAWQMGHFSCPPTNTDKKICRYLNNFVTLPTKKRNNLMKSLSIKDTTLEERRQIVQEALNFGAGDCDGQDLSDIYDDYILGLKELADINREFSEKHAGEVVAGELTKPSTGCMI